MEYNVKLNVDKVYICHYSKLIERKKHVIDQLNSNKIDNYQFVELYDKNELNDTSINFLYPNINNFFTNMNDAEKSLALKHAWIVEDMFQKNYSSILVLEDDVVLCQDFIKKFNFYKDQLPLDWELGWVGSCCNLKEPEIENTYVYKTNRGSRCTHAFCLNKNFAVKMHNEFKKINLPSDFYYNHLIKTFNLNNYWFQPPLAFQSLEFNSSLKQNPNHKWQPAEMN